MIGGYLEYLDELADQQHAQIVEDLVHRVRDLRLLMFGWLMVTSIVFGMAAGEAIRLHWWLVVALDGVADCGTIVGAAAAARGVLWGAGR